LHCGHLVGCGMYWVVWWGGTLGPNTGLRLLLQRTTQNDLLNYKGVKVAYVYLSMLLVNVYIFERDWVRKRRNKTYSPRVCFSRIGINWLVEHVNKLSTYSKVFKCVQTCSNMFKISFRSNSTIVQK
jgi:hypothetical protein